MADLEPGVAKTYAAVIDDILAGSNLTTISAKAIRRGLQERGYDIAEHKAEVTQLIHERFDLLNANSKSSPDADADITTNENGHATSPSELQSPSSGTNGHASYTSPTNPKKRTTSDASTSASSPSDTLSTPPKKKLKKEKAASVEEDDAALAARLQAEYNAASRTRATRGAASRKDRAAPKTKKRGKKKSANIIEDSDLESGNGSGGGGGAGARANGRGRVVKEKDAGKEKEKGKKKGGFHKEFALSEPLAALVGETKLSRPATVQKIWQYIKANNLQVPEDKRNIRCDDSLRAVFKQDKVHMFSMNKTLSQHLYPLDAEYTE